MNLSPQQQQQQRRKFQKSPKILKICRKFLKKKVFFEALILYRIEKKKSLSLFIAANPKGHPKK